MSPGAEHGDVDDEPASTLTWAALVLDVGVGELGNDSGRWSEMGIRMGMGKKFGTPE